MVKQGPRPLVICGPSGSGKSTLLKKLFEELPKTFGFRFVFSLVLFSRLAICDKNNEFIRNTRKEELNRKTFQLRHNRILADLPIKQ